jgi:energy-coupling factor transport system ATP-binding protein
MLAAQNLTCWYAKEKKPIFQNLNYILYDDKSINIIIGSNGIGKTTFAECLCGIIPHFRKAHIDGSVKWNDLPIHKSDVHKIVSFMFQNPRHYFICDTVQGELDQLGPIPRLLQSYYKTMTSNISSSDRINHLSGGQQQRLALLCALLRKASLVCLDEPFSFLDVNARIWAQGLLSNSDRPAQYTLILENHIPKYSFQPAAQIFKLTDKELTKDIEESDALLPINYERNYMGSFTFHFESINFAYKTLKPFQINDFNLDIAEGECLGMVGLNGSGKSTILRILAGLVNPKQGKFFYHKELLSRQKRRSIIRYACQDPDWQLFETNVKNELLFARKWDNSLHDPFKLLYEWEINLPFSLSAEPYQLSYGQRKLLALLCIFVLSPKLLLLDEPFAGLDLFTRNVVLKLLSDFLNHGGSAIVASHDYDLINLVSNRIIQMEQGRISSITTKI